MRHFIAPSFAFATALALAPGTFAQSPEQLAKLLKRFPLADANQDGTLTTGEALAYHEKARNSAPDNRPAPSLSAVSYAPDPESLLDFWKPESNKPTPLLIFIHGGGFKAGSRKGLKPEFIEKALAEGFAVISIDYPFLDKKPVQEILPLAARAVQFARYKAAEWNIDSARIAVLGGSAGAGTSLWIAAHPDLADPKSEDPVSRQSSRVQAAASINGQATYDLLKWEELVGPPPAGILRDESEPLRFYHLPAGSDLQSEAAKAARAKVDIHGLLDKTTPPLFLFTSQRNPGKAANDRGGYVHSPRHSEAIAAKAGELGIPHELVVHEKAAGKDGIIESIAFFKKQFEAIKETPREKKEGVKDAALFKPDSTPVYKTIGDVSLKLHVFNPPARQPSEKSPAVVFFFGGGFRTGAPTQFYPHSTYLASRGIVAISAEYRIKKVHGTDPEKSVSDAKSALRWIRSHANELGVDPDRIAAGGGSAGGFLAAATATLSGYDEAGEDTSISPKPNALLIYNGPFTAGPGKNFGRAETSSDDAWKSFSPLHHISSPFPPTAFFVGTEDKLIPVSESEKIKTEVTRAGGRFDLHLYEGQKHGFFNHSRNGGEYYKITLRETDLFLSSLGWLTGSPLVEN